MRARVVRHKVTKEVFLVTRSGAHISYGIGVEAEERAKKAANKANAGPDRDAALRSLGLTKVKGNLGGIYWE